MISLENPNDLTVSLSLNDLAEKLDSKSNNELQFIEIFKFMFRMNRQDWLSRNIQVCTEVFTMRNCLSLCLSRRLSLCVSRRDFKEDHLKKVHRRKLLVQTFLQFHHCTLLRLASRICP